MSKPTTISDALLSAMAATGDLRALEAAIAATMANDPNGKIVLRDAAIKASRLVSALSLDERKYFFEWEISTFADLVG